MEEVALIIILLAVAAAAVLILVVLAQGRYRPPMDIDITRHEMELMDAEMGRRSSIRSPPSSSTRGGELYRKGLIGGFRIYEGGIKAWFAKVAVQRGPEVRGFKRPFVHLDFKRGYVPFEDVTGVYPIKVIEMTRTRYGSDPAAEVGRNERTRDCVQIETVDLATAVLEPPLARNGAPDVDTLLQRIGAGRGLEGRASVAPDQRLVGVLFHHRRMTRRWDSEEGPHWAPEVERKYYLMDMHKHAFLRSMEGYQARRDETLSKMMMTDSLNFEEIRRFVWERSRRT